MGCIRGYKDGANLTLVNTVYIKPKKMEDGKYTNDVLYIIYRDMETNEKKVETIIKPQYTYYIAKKGVNIPHNMMYIPMDMVEPVTCRYNGLLKSIAKETNNYEWFKDNNNNGNFKENIKLHNIPSVFMSDTNIEDYYRFLFDITYTNEPYYPTKLYFDIETDIIDMKGDFPMPGECPVNAITLIDETGKNVYVLLLENYNNPLIEEFKQRKSVAKELKDFVKSRVGGWKREKLFGLDEFEYKIAFFDEEINLIKACFDLINTIKPDFALAWNIAFDLPYLIERIKVLGYSPESIICHPDFPVKICDYYIDHRASKFEERGDGAEIASYTVYVDQLIAFASRRKGQRAVSSYKLDYIGNVYAGVRKLDYSHITRDIAKLPYLDYKTFVFYNCMDTIVQYCIEKEVADIDFIFNKSLTNNTRYSKVHRQTTYLVNRGKRFFYDKGYIFGNNINKNNEKESFAGAFVADPTLVSDKPKIKINSIAINILKNGVDFDYTALYPSIIEQSNMSPATMYGKILFDNILDPKENRYNNPYFDRSVWFMEDLLSNNTIDFCSRYLGMPDYEKMYDLIIEFFTMIKNPRRAFRYTDTLKGNRIMMHSVDNSKPKQMYHLIDKNEKRNMIIIQERMPDIL